MGCCTKSPATDVEPPGRCPPPHRRAKSGVAGGLQRPIQNGRWPVLLSIDDHRSFQSGAPRVSRAPVGDDRGRQTGVPGEVYAHLTRQFGTPIYERVDATASSQQKAALKKLSPNQITATELAGEKILAKITHAPEGGAAIGGL